MAKYDTYAYAKFLKFRVTLNVNVFRLICARLCAINHITFMFKNLAVFFKGPTKFGFNSVMLKLNFLPNIEKVILISCWSIN